MYDTSKRLDIGFTLFTPIKGRIDSLTVYIYKAEKCTNILRYNTCMSSYRGDRKCTKNEEKYEKPICGITRNNRHDPGIPF
jgi:hypothetical protein